MSSRIGVLIATLAAILLVPVSSALAAADLRISATHSPQTFLKTTNPNTTVYGGALTLTVSNQGADPTDGSPVTVTNPLPAGLTALVNNPGFDAGTIAASGAGWSCSGAATSTCTRSDVLAPGEAYPPIRITVRVANNAAALLTNTPTVQGGGSAGPSSDADSIPVEIDACPNGWSPEETVAFGPPAPEIDSGIVNPELVNGCTLLDQVWAEEPFADHDSFVSHVGEVAKSFVDEGLLTPRQRAAIVSAAARSNVAKASDEQMPDTCDRRVALTLDDGPSAYRPQTFQILRDKQVTGVLFDMGVRIDANPQWVKFALEEGHQVLSHTYWHPNMNNLFAGDPALVVEELADTEAAVIAAAGRTFSHRGMRPPFLASNAGVTQLLTSLGYTNHVSGTQSTSDWDPATSALQIENSIVNALRPGGIILMHDGPSDTPAGANTVAAMTPIIDRARALGYCFGKLDDKNNVVASRHVPTSTSIPPVVNPVPYLPLVRAGTPPDPWEFIPQPLELSATHSPEPFVRGTSAALTLTVTNVSSEPTDTSTISVINPIPSGLTATSASGPGWTCTGGGTRTCTRSHDPLAPGASYPPITIAVNVSATAPATITNTPRVTGHGGNVWLHQTSDTISVVSAP